MGNKKFILNADDFGLNNETNKAVLEGHLNGFLSSASLCANGEAFDNAINEVVPECPELGMGIHLNIIEGQTVQNFTKTSKLTDLNGYFNNSFQALLAKSYDNFFLDQVESEFRNQIEKVLKYYSTPDHIDSHVHVHAIPNIFEITCKLAKEYDIPFVRTQFEKFYITPNLKKHITIKYPPNLAKIALLNTFTLRNRNIIKSMDLKTNDKILGVGYTGLMDSNTVRAGLEGISEDGIVEALIHPMYLKNSNNQHYKEFLITRDMDLKDKIQRLGFEITNYKTLSNEKI